MFRDHRSVSWLHARAGVEPSGTDHCEMNSPNSRNQAHMGGRTLLGSHTGKISTFCTNIRRQGP
eukprot:527703-Prymnesium_polylepis.1